MVSAQYVGAQVGASPADKCSNRKFKPHIPEQQKGTFQLAFGEGEGDAGKDHRHRIVETRFTLN